MLLLLLFPGFFKTIVCNGEKKMKKFLLASILVSLLALTVSCQSNTPTTANADSSKTTDTAKATDSDKSEADKSESKEDAEGEPHTGGEGDVHADKG